MDLNNITYKYPLIKRDENYIDEYGMKDPYHWLENYDTENTKNFVKEQNEFSNNYFSQHSELK